MYKIGIKIDNTENKIEREAITKNNLQKLTQSFIPVFVPLVCLSHSQASLTSIVFPVKAYRYSNTPIKAMAVNTQRN